ncbi:hypothetical protein [Actinomadura madurae]|uniref:hypothetical protein n=1 Tax=Actinomadura madurae TaxID=1993 RepID=UPI0020D23874|nr:hypothetical protein [Actinomadura madurae]MCP9963801.1 hypothetical protein [Actinomadura madurae]MCQ0012466.1 hypothetical protein [Actinomadura madurae]
MENPDVAWGQRARDGVWVPTRDGQRIHFGIDVAAADTVAQVLRPSLRVFVGVDVDTDIVAQTTAAGCGCSPSSTAPTPPPSSGSRSPSPTG